MNTSFKILFSIELFHDYYNLQESFDDVEIIPTDNTKRLFKGYKIIYKSYGNKLTALAAVDTGSNTFIKIEEGVAFRFILKLKNPIFINISNLKIFESENQIYYFSNRSNNKKDGIYYLSGEIPGYDENEDYEMGSLVKDDSGVYEAIQHSSPSSQHDPSEFLFWRKLNINRFPIYTITAVNMIANHPDIYKGNLFSAGTKMYEAKKYIPKDFTFQLNDNEYIQELTEPQYGTANDLLDKDYINIRQYYSDDHPDIYKGTIVFADSNIYKAKNFIPKGDAVSVSDSNYWENISGHKFVVSDDTISPADNVFGVVDVFFDSPASSEYSMINDSGTVKEINYVIRFKNRITTWKYYSAKNNVISIKDITGLYKFDGPGNPVISTEPIPLCAKPLNNFQVTSGNITASPIKCASSFIKADKISKIFSSEIFLNY